MIDGLFVIAISKGNKVIAIETRKSIRHQLCVRFISFLSTNLRNLKVDYFVVSFMDAHQQAVKETRVVTTTATTSSLTIVRYTTVFAIELLG